MGDYETDILVWSQHQATLLRRMAAGHSVNEAPDWANIIEEVESVGNEQVAAVTSLLQQALIHLLKAQGWPESRDAPVWQADAINFQGLAAARFVPSMRQRIDLSQIYRRARRAVPKAIDGRPPLALPETCPFTLDELLSEP